MFFVSTSYRFSTSYTANLLPDFYQIISSYLQTMANLGYNPLTAIQMTLAGQIEAYGGE
jgi:hypothetical protein